MSAGAGEEVHELVRARLGRVDQRYTEGRRSLVDLLAVIGRPLSITDIGEHLPRLPRSSAYRHLVDLERAGVVRRISARDGFSRFELVEDLTEHHHHLVCTGCGQVVDVTPSRSFERTVSQHVEELASRAGFHAQAHQVEVLGICGPCREAFPA